MEGRCAALFALADTPDDAVTDAAGAGGTVYIRDAVLPVVS